MIAGEAPGPARYEIVGVCGRTNEITVIDVDELAQLRAKYKRLLACVRWYADEGEWEDAHFDQNPHAPWLVAQQALEEVGE